VARLSRRLEWSLEIVHELQEKVNPGYEDLFRLMDFVLTPSGDAGS
jgi:hypothetical protein